MDVKSIKIEALEPEEFLIGVKFEVATARIEGQKLLRFDITELVSEEERDKFYSTVSKGFEK